MLSLREDLRIRNEAGVNIFLNEEGLTSSDKKEFVSNDKYEAQLSNLSDGRIILSDILHKSNFIRTFELVIDRLSLTGSETVLEMGAAHGWASAMLKALHPACYIVASDLMDKCIAHAADWEKLLGVRIDEKWAFNCRDLPFADGQFDRIFTFASFHHFGVNGNFTKALAEMVRLLKPGGKIVLLYEPSSPQWCYKRAFRRVNRRQLTEGVDEDVLVCNRLGHEVAGLGCQFEVERFPIFRFRDSVASTNYYFVLSKVPFFRVLLPSTVNIVIQK